MKNAAHNLHQLTVAFDRLGFTLVGYDEDGDSWEPRAVTLADFEERVATYTFTFAPAGIHRAVALVVLAFDETLTVAMQEDGYPFEEFTRRSVPGDGFQMGPEVAERLTLAWAKSFWTAMWDQSVAERAEKRAEERA